MASPILEEQMTGAPPEHRTPRTLNLTVCQRSDLVEGSVVGERHYFFNDFEPHENDITAPIRRLIRAVADYLHNERIEVTTDSLTLETITCRCPQAAGVIEVRFESPDATTTDQTSAATDG
ncbi:MAG: hypothetical protein OXI97_06990 [Acidimicrobiaceae bacterium]|nr:hypothetical protein [Acidimicrobiaceae bacterium]